MKKPMPAHRLPSVIALCAALCGCTGMPMRIDQMTPEQLAAAARDRTIVVACGGGRAPGIRVQAAFLQIDPGVVRQGTVTVSGDCEVSADVRQGGQ